MTRLFLSRKPSAVRRTDRAFRRARPALEGLEGRSLQSALSPTPSVLLNPGPIMPAVYYPPNPC
jgi:hypothetical protein